MNWDVLIEAAVRRPDAMKLSESESKILTASPSSLLALSHKSHTQIDMYIRCPQQYYQRYILGKKTPPGVALVEGSAHHVALDVNNQHKARKGEDLTAKKLHSVFADAFSDAKKEIENWEDENENRVIGRGKGLLTSYLGSEATKLMPEASEEAFALMIGPVKFVGLIDFVGKYGVKKTIIDYKTVSRDRTQKDADISPQLSGYAAALLSATGQEADLGFCNLNKSTLRTSIVKADKRGNEARIRWFRHITLSVANAIALGNFPVTDPSSWMCSKRFCGYYDGCRGAVEKGPTKLVISAKKK